MIEPREILLDTISAQFPAPSDVLTRRDCTKFGIPFTEGAKYMVLYGFRYNATLIAAKRIKRLPRKYWNP